MKATQQLHAEDGEAHRTSRRQRGVGYEFVAGDADKRREHVSAHDRPGLGKFAERDDEEQKRRGSHGEHDESFGSRSEKVAAESDQAGDGQKTSRARDDLFFPSGLVPFHTQPCFDSAHRWARDRMNRGKRQTLRSNPDRWALW